MLRCFEVFGYIWYICFLHPPSPPPDGVRQWSLLKPPKEFRSKGQMLIHMATHNVKAIAEPLPDPGQKTLDGTLLTSPLEKQYLDLK